MFQSPAVMAAADPSGPGAVSAANSIAVIAMSMAGYGPEGVTSVNPPTRDGLFPCDNSEILSKPVFEPGQTMTIDIKGAPDLTTHNGTAGWGVSNRSIDPLGLEIAWFMQRLARLGRRRQRAHPAGLQRPRAGLAPRLLPDGQTGR
jgi:hypothetical protein